MALLLTCAMSGKHQVRVRASPRPAAWGRETPPQPSLRSPGKPGQAFRRKCCKPTVLLLAHPLLFLTTTPSLFCPSLLHIVTTWPPIVQLNMQGMTTIKRPGTRPAQYPHHLDLHHPLHVHHTPEHHSCLQLQWEFLEQAIGMHESRSITAYHQSQAPTATPLPSVANTTPHVCSRTECQIRVR